MGDELNDLAIVGGGPAAYTAALYALRAGLKVSLWVGPQKGGQLMTTEAIENWPAGEAGLTGPELMARFEAQLQRLQLQPQESRIERVQLVAESPRRFQLLAEGASAPVATARAVIWATGARARYLGLPSEQQLMNQGVSACATCDGFLYRGRCVAVVGGGNTALEEALLLSELAKQVILIHRRLKFRAEAMLQRRLLERVQKGSVILELGQEVQEVLGSPEQGVTGVRTLILEEGREKILPVDALFVAIGHLPAVEGVLHLCGGEAGKTLGVGFDGYPTQTRCPGLFAAGDVADPLYRQAITAAAMGCQAALDAHRYLELQE